MANITKRKDSYLIRVSCGYDTKGKQIIKSKTWRPAPGMTERQTQKELNRVAIEFEAAVENGNLADTHRIKMDKFCEEYLELVKPTISPVTYSYYTRIVNTLIIPHFGHMRVKDIKPIHVQRFIQALQKPEARIDGKGGLLSASSVQRYFTVLKSVMAKAYKLGYTDINPTETTRLDIPPIEQSEIEVYSKEEAAKMLKCLEDEPLQFKLLIHLAIVTGCRRGELVALQWDCIDYQRKTIEVKQSNYQVKGGGVKTKTTKTKSSIRTIAIPQYCIDILRKYRAAQGQERLKIASLWKGGNWVFTQWDGSPMHPHTPTRWFEKFQKRHNLPHHKFHALRHTSATLLLTDGTNIKTVSARLGHTQLQTTNRYLHSLTAPDEAAARTFEGLIEDEKIGVMNK